MKAIDFRFRPNTPDAVDGLIHNPFFGDMCAFFNYPDRAWSASLDKIVEIMDEHEITGVITGRDVETTYGCPCSNMGVVEMMRAYPTNSMAWPGSIHTRACRPSTSFPAWSTNSA